MYLSTIHVNDQGPVINGSVKVRIQHEHMGDLKMRIAHAGLVLDLKYVDPADTSQSLCVTYPVGLVPSTGQMGDWQLEVWDTATPWGGELVSWSLFLE